MEISKRDWSCGIGDEPEEGASNMGASLLHKVPEKFRGWVVGGLAAGAFGLAYWFGTRGTHGRRHY